LSFADPDARPVRKGKIANPTQFGYVSQLAELTGSTKRGSRGLILPPVTRPGSVHENQLLPATVAELRRLGLRPAEAVFDAGFGILVTRDALRRPWHPGLRRRQPDEPGLTPDPSAAGPLSGRL